MMMLYTKNVQLGSLTPLSPLAWPFSLLCSGCHGCFPAMPHNPLVAPDGAVASLSMPVRHCACMKRARKDCFGVQPQNACLVCVNALVLLSGNLEI